MIIIKVNRQDIPKVQALNLYCIILQDPANDYIEVVPKSQQEMNRINKALEA